jgi:pseudaminic acid biosynthesis-associated methylase
MSDQPETSRLEALWSGEFGDEYVDRNLAAYDQREAFWTDVLTRAAPARVLEVGCNVGGNLRWIRRHTEGAVCGVDVNRKALTMLQREVEGCDTILAPARELPYRDRWFDLVFTMGVLIHQPESTLPLVMSEMVRCSSRWVLCGEYFADETTEVGYRGHEGALFKRDYGRLFVELYPDLRLEATGFLGTDDGWDDITWWLFERPA